MASRTKVPYLRLVEPPEPREPLDDSAPAQSRELGGALLGFVDTSTATRTFFEDLVTRVRPTWIFDLRPVPYFDIQGLSRRKVFALFREHEIAYRDVSGLLELSGRDDASLGSGAVAWCLHELLAADPTRPPAPIVVLLDDKEWVAHAAAVLPPMLQQPAEGWDVRVLNDESMESTTAAPNSTRSTTENLTTDS
jgi:hypothetical protein